MNAEEKIFGPLNATKKKLKPLVKNPMGGEFSE